MNPEQQNKNRRHQRAATDSCHAHQQANRKALKRIERINHLGHLVATSGRPQISAWLRAAVMTKGENAQMA
jgi:hypothetical protein